MIYDWYKIINKTEFEASDIESKELTLTLTGKGTKDFLVTKGNYISILVDDIFLSLNLNEKNPFEFEDMAIWLDVDTQDIWVGYLHED